MEIKKNEVLIKQLKHVKLDKKELHKQIKQHKITKLQLYKKELKKSIDKRKYLFDDIQFEHTKTEAAWNGNIITYFVRQQNDNAKKHYDHDIILIDEYEEEDKGSSVNIHAYIFNIIEKMIPERQKNYEMELNNLKNIISTERLRCTFRIPTTDFNLPFQYITVSLPSERSEYKVVHKFLNKTSIVPSLKKSTQNFVEAIEDFCESGSGFQLVSVAGMYCNINKYAPLRGATYIDLPEYFKNKKCIINVQNKDNRCFA